MAGLYVHVPFCASKCRYCDFYSVAGAGHRPWAAALLDEARTRAPEFGRFETLYLGGGTPSLLGRGLLARLLRELLSICRLAPGAEVTLEANPDDVDAAALSAWRRAGVNRLSLGLQALDDAALVFLGRRHTARQGLEAARLARGAGFDNLGLDLIWGLPGQDLSGWSQTLERALELRPEHLSCYQLTLEPHTPLGREAARGQLALPDEDSARALLLATSELLRAAGYQHYEVSNFARRPVLRSRHNQIYWRRQPYLGLGPSAHSFDGQRRWWNVASVEDYVRRLASGGDPTQGQERLDAEQQTLELLMLGLRTSDGVDLEQVRRIPRWERTLAALQREGLVSLQHGRVCPTLDGLALADGLPLRFFP